MYYCDSDRYGWHIDKLRNPELSSSDKVLEKGIKISAGVDGTMGSTEFSVLDFPASRIQGE